MSSEPKSEEKPIASEGNPIDFHYLINCITFFNCNLKISYPSTEGNWKNDSFMIFFCSLRTSVKSRERQKSRQCHHQTSSHSPERWRNNFPVTMQEFSLVHEKAAFRMLRFHSVSAENAAQKMCLSDELFSLLLISRLTGKWFAFTTCLFNSFFPFPSYLTFTCFP